MTRIAIAALFASACALFACSGCSCRTVGATSWQGTLSYSVTAGDAAPAVGSKTTTITLDPFDPSAADSHDYSGDLGYCGPDDFTVAIGAACRLSARIGDVTYQDNFADTYTATATIASGQDCTIVTTSGPRHLIVEGGTLNATNRTIDLTFGGASSTATFVGSET